MEEMGMSSAGGGGERERDRVASLSAMRGEVEEGKGERDGRGVERGATLRRRARSEEGRQGERERERRGD